MGGGGFREVSEKVQINYIKFLSKQKYVKICNKKKYVDILNIFTFYAFSVCQHQASIRAISGPRHISVSIFVIPNKFDTV